MSSFTFADLKLGGRLTAACEAIAAGHLNRAAGIFSEIADDLNQEATANGLLADEPLAEEDWSAPLPESPKLLFEKMQQTAQAADLTSCSRGAHLFGPPAPVTGWRECTACGYVNVAPPDGGAIDMGVRR